MAFHMVSCPCVIRSAAKRGTAALLTLMMSQCTLLSFRSTALQEAERMFQGSGWANAARSGPAEAGGMRLAVDVIETDDAFTFATDVPGVSRQDVKVCLAIRPCRLPPLAHCGYRLLVDCDHIRSHMSGSDLEWRCTLAHKLTTVVSFGAGASQEGGA